MTDTQKLRDKINSKGIKLKFLAKQLGLTYYGLSLKINNMQDFRANEIAKLCQILNINDLEEKENIFFAQ